MVNYSTRLSTCSLCAGTNAKATKRVLTPDRPTAVSPSSVSFLFMLPSPNRNGTARRNAKDTRTFGRRLATVSEGWPKHEAADISCRCLVLLYPTHNQPSFSSCRPCATATYQRAVHVAQVFTQEYLRFCVLTTRSVRGHTPVPAP